VINSLRRRIFVGVASVAVATALLMSLVVYFAYEDLERSMLNLVFSDEEAFFLAHLDLHGNHLETATLDALFIPNGTSSTIPTVFEGLPAPYLGELRRGDRTYLVHIERLNDGTLYLAKDISLFERREALFHITLAVTVVLVLAIGVLLAYLTARRIARPLARLARAVDRLVPGQPINAERRFPVDFEEAELRRIAEPFAYYLDQLDQLMMRERRLLAMASHELRTPVSTIAGALDVIDKHGTGAPPGGPTLRALQRVRVASEEMRAQIDAILALSRGGADGRSCVRIELTAVCEQLIGELADAGLPAQRIALSRPEHSVSVETDPTLAKMLLRNLLHNTLEHTPSGPIRLRIADGEISVEDQGPGLPLPYQRLLGRPGEQPAPSEGGLGLYLVSLIAERLQWRLTTATPAQGGTRITIGWQPPQEAEPAN
jgi:signal transduction histidine kinase